MTEAAGKPIEQASRDNGGNGIFRVIMGSARASFPCASDETVLAAARRGAPGHIEFGCEGGGCGLCRIRILEGSVERGRMSRAHVTPDDEMSGIALACRTYPVSNLVIDTARKVRP